MGEQHYGRAPCGCSRAWDGSCRIGDVTELCEPHGLYGRPWHAASAIEQGLRAIAGWEYSERRAFNEALAYWLDYPGPVYGAKLTEVVGHPDEFADCDCPSHAGEDGEVVVRPSARTTCYFCARPVSDGVCTVCGERQPTTEREDT